MAINIIDDEEDKDKQNNGVQAPQAVPTSAPQAVGGSASPMAQPANSTGKTGSGFVNLQNVLNANRNNKLGSTIASGIGNVAGQAKSSLDRSQQAFNTGVGEAETKRTANLGQAQGVINRIGQGPNAQNEPLITDQDAAAFAQYRSGEYQGPQGLANADQLQEQAQRAEQLGRQVNSVEGQQNLLQQFVGKSPDYSSGKRALDALLLGQTGAQQLRQGRKDTFGLGNQVSSAGIGAQEAAKLQQAKELQFSDQVKKMLGDTESGVNTDIDAALAAEQQKEQGRSSQYQAIKDILGKQFDPNSRDGQSVVNMKVGSPPVGQPKGPKDIGDVYAPPTNSQPLTEREFNFNKAEQALAEMKRQNLLDPTKADTITRLLNAIRLDPQLDATVGDPVSLINNSLNYEPGTALQKNMFIDQNRAAKLNALSQLSGGAKDKYKANEEAIKGGHTNFNDQSVYDTLSGSVNANNSRIAAENAQQAEQARLAEEARRRAAEDMQRDSLLNPRNNFGAPISGARSFIPR